MVPIEQTILTTIRENNLIEKNQTVLTAVSGGSDSTALLCLLMNIIPAKIKAAAYINHNLRPDETEAEKKHVMNLCQSFGIDFIYKSVDVNSEKATSGESTEECSRRLRYHALEKIRKSIGSDLIAVGHTSDDQAEELLIRLIRGSGLKGLSGMKLKNEKIIRPLLYSSKQDLLNFLAANNTPYCLDSSNRSKAFLRNRIRLELLPILEETFNPSIRQTLHNTAAILRDENNYLEIETDHFYHATVNETASQMKPTSKELFYFLDPFSKIHPAVQRRILEKMCWRAGSKPSFRTIEDILRLTAHGRTGSELHMPAGLTILKTTQKIIFLSRAKRSPIQRQKEDLFEKTITINLPGTYHIDELGKTLTIREISTPTSVPADNTLFIDLNRADFPWTLRGAVPGETFVPLGAPGRKKISRFFSDRKISKHLRHTFPLLVSGKEIVAVAGMIISNQVKIKQETSRYLEIIWE